MKRSVEKNAEIEETEGASCCNQKQCENARIIIMHKSIHPAIHLFISIHISSHINANITKLKCNRDWDRVMCVIWWVAFSLLYSLIIINFIIKSCNSPRNFVIKNCHFSLRFKFNSNLLPHCVCMCARSSRKFLYRSTLFPPSALNFLVTPFPRLFHCNIHAHEQRGSEREWWSSKIFFKRKIIAMVTGNWQLSIVCDMLC